MKVCYDSRVECLDKSRNLTPTLPLHGRVFCIIGDFADIKTHNAWTDSIKLDANGEIAPGQPWRLL